MKWSKILTYTLSGILLLIIIAISYVKFALPNVGPPPNITIEGSPDQIARGEYLANNVMVCMQCHSQRDFSLFGGPSKPGTSGIGGEPHDQSMGFPGSYISTNLTPYHLSEWTDGEIFRAITSGVNRDGKALFPIMPHPNFGQLDEEDIKAVIAYLRTLESVPYEPAPSKSDFPMNFIVNFMPKKATLKQAPSKSDMVAYGQYLVTAGSCRSCHTNHDSKGNPFGPEFGGGMEFHFPDGSILRAPNLTPHNSGIGNWTAEQFVDRFKTYSDSSYVPHKVNQGDFQTVMPWFSYTNMTKEDLTAIYEYLKSNPPADNVVEKFTPAEL